MPSNDHFTLSQCYFLYAGMERLAREITRIRNVHLADHPRRQAALIRAMVLGGAFFLAFVLAVFV